MDRVVEDGQLVKGLVSEAVRSSQYLLLASERQATLDGGLEPLLDTSQPVVDAVDAAASSDAQAGLFGPTQLPFALQPLHRPVNGEPPIECVTNKAGRSRGYESRVACRNAPGEVVTVRRLCKRMNCECSRESNARTRAKRAREGTARKGLSVGLGDFGDVPLLVAVFTIPLPLRHLLVGKNLTRWRSGTAKIVGEIFEQQGSAGAPLFIRAFFHPVGEPSLSGVDEDKVHVEQDGTTYVPHENFLVPCAVNRYGKARRLPAFLPPEWLGRDGWICALYRELLVELFGQWWPEGEQPPAVNVFFEYRKTPEEKAHAAKYFARPFPGWHSRKDIPMRPKTLGLGHWKHKAELVSLVSQLTPGGLEAVRNPPCHKCGQAECRPLCASGPTEERAVQAIQRLLAGVRADYLEYWRIMTPAACVQGIEPPGLDPPRVYAVRDAAESSLPASSLH